MLGCVEKRCKIPIIGGRISIDKLGTRSPAAYGFEVQESLKNLKIM
jgi:hypothetical protein